MRKIFGIADQSCHLAGGVSVLARATAGIAPLVIEAEGFGAKERFFEFFAATIRNRHTREAYMRAVYRFMDWVEQRQLSLAQIRPLVVATYIENLAQELSAPSVKQHLAAIRGLFDYLVTGHVVIFNPASSVRGPKHVVQEGKTPILEPEELRTLFESIDTNTLLGLRDRALLGVLLYSFARISAAVGLKVKDYRHLGRSSYFRFHEKGGKVKDVPVHHKAQEYLDAYMEAAQLEQDPKGWLFRAAGPQRKTIVLGDKPFNRRKAWAMVKRRLKKAGLNPDACNHSFRGSGITVYLENGGDLETAADIAGHASTKTTRLYDRTKRTIKRGEIERVHI